METPLTNAYGSCTPGSSDVNCQALPAMSGFFLGIMGDVMVKDKLGFGVDYSIQPAKQNYGPLQDRQSFIDFDGIYRPIQTKKAALRYFRRHRRRAHVVLDYTDRLRGNRGLSNTDLTDRKRQPLRRTRGHRRPTVRDRALLHPAAIRYTLCEWPDRPVRPQRSACGNGLGRLQLGQQINTRRPPLPVFLILQAGSDFNFTSQLPSATIPHQACASPSVATD